MTLPFGIADELLAERWRQIDAEDYSQAHDDAHVRAELARAAASRAIEAAAQLDPTPEHELWAWSRRLWPFADRSHREKDPRRCLVIAGALIIAEIERLDRAPREGQR